MIHTGLLSVTFRKLTPEEIITLVSQAGLQAIEWGGDIHVPHGEVATAEKIGKMTRDNGLQVASYGSYYKTGIVDSAKVEFERVLETALALGAPAIRVWAGNRGSDSSEEAWRDQVISDTSRIAELTAKEGLTIDFEYHGRTLTDTTESTVRLLEAIDHPNVRCNWQPPVHETAEQRLYGLQRITPWLANIHVFHWRPGLRCALEDGMDEWIGYTGLIRKTGRAHYMLLEFVQNDSPDQFLKDAEILKRIVGSYI
jgi:3-dehydroshikimate dehydratase